MARNVDDIIPNRAALQDWRVDLAGRIDQRLKWQLGDIVQVLMGKVIPYNSGYIQTAKSRRKRLRTVLEPLLAESGWREIPRDVYSKASSDETRE